MLRRPINVGPEQREGGRFDCPIRVADVDLAVCEAILHEGCKAAARQRRRRFAPKADHDEVVVMA